MTNIACACLPSLHPCERHWEHMDRLLTTCAKSQTDQMHEGDPIAVGDGVLLHVMARCEEIAGRLREKAMWMEMGQATG